MARHKAKSVVNDVERLLSWAVRHPPGKSSSTRTPLARLARKRYRRAAKPLLMAKLHMKVDFIKKKLAAVKYGK